jgi:hypothetical protein
MIALFGIHSYVFIAVFGVIILVMVGVEDSLEEIRNERDQRAADERERGDHADGA